MALRRVQIHNAGDIGIVKETDAKDHAIPPEAWTDGKNVRFLDGKVKKFTGHDEVFAQMTIAPYQLLAVPYLDSSFWLALGLARVEALTGTAVNDITRASGAYEAISRGSWSASMFAGLAVMNNYVDVPQYWADAVATQLLQDFPAWPANVRANVIRPYKNYLVALGITKEYNTASEAYYPNMIKVSHPADPGSMPSTWDETDQTKDALERDLVDDEAGELLDGKQLGDRLIMYKEGSTHYLQHIGGTFIHENKRIFDTSGILAMNCVADLPKVRGATAGHFVHNGHDLIIHDGQAINSVVDNKMRKFLNANIDTNAYFRSFCITNLEAKEMWFCFPETGSEFCTLAATFSLVDGTIGIRELPGVSGGHSGIIDTGGSQEVWDNIDETWDSVAANAVADGLWDGRTFTQFNRGIMLADPTSSKIFRADTTEEFDGSAFTAFVERKGIAIIGRDADREPVLDFSHDKIINRVWPKMRGGPVDIKVGMQATMDGAITWSTPVTFDPATDTYIDPDPVPSGRLPAIHFSSTGSETWELDGYDIEMDVLGLV